MLLVNRDKPLPDNYVTRETLIKSGYLEEGTYGVYGYYTDNWGNDYVLETLGPIESGKIKNKYNLSERIMQIYKIIEFYDLPSGIQYHFITRFGFNDYDYDKLEEGVQEDVLKEEI